MLALIDKLSKIAKSVGDEAVNAARKSGELLEITKLNHSISNEEDKIKAIYTELGNICYQKFQSGVELDPDLVNGCNRIEEIKNNIAALKQKILEVKSVKACQSCGNELALDVSFCSKCGTKQVAEDSTATDETKACASCGAKLSADSAFCTSCGTKI